MANFQTHINVGLLVSAGATIILRITDLIQIEQTPLCFALGVAGSVLPDIDATHSKPAQTLITILAAGVGFTATLPWINRLSNLELLFLWCGIFILVRYGLASLLTHFTIHRGLWHSWLALAGVVLATTDAVYWLAHQSVHFAWIAGISIGIGYLTHLILDEIASVDLVNQRIKRSFGTALKPFSYTAPSMSLALFAIILWLLWIAPALHHRTYFKTTDFQAILHNIWIQISRVWLHFVHWLNL